MQLKIFELKPLFLKASIPCAIILIILFAYGDVWNHQFLNYDDNMYVTENSRVQNGLNLESIRWAFGFVGVSCWHPMTWISHMLDCQLFGLAPGPHHMVNVAIHILNALFLFLIIFKITGARYKAAVVALLFAVHPLNVESVAWVSERKNVLSTLFFMIAIYAYVLYVEKKKIWMYCLVLCAYTLGLMSKPSIVTFPFLLLILDYWPLGRFGMGGAYNTIDAVRSSFFRRFRFRILAFRKSKAPFLFLEKTPFIILSLISFYLSMISMSKFHVIIKHGLIPVDLRIYNLFVSIMKYVGNMAWPFGLSIYYPFPKTIPAAHFLLALSFVLLITVMTFLWRKSRPWLFTGWFWFLIALAPVGGLIQAALWPEMANRYMYIPMIGLFLMLVWECDARIRGGYAKTFKVILFCAMLVYYISLTKYQNHFFSDNYTLFSRAVTVTGENHIVYSIIGDGLLSLNRVDEAMVYYRKAIAINPKFAKALYNYGTCLLRRGDYINAGSYFSRVIAINPNDTLAYATLGWTQAQKGYSDEAKKLLEKALELDPDDGYSHNVLGAILAGQGKTEEAIRHFQIAVEKNPNYVEARMNLSLTYEKAGLYDRAIAEYEALCKVAQADKKIINYRIAGLFARQNKYEECKRHLEISLSLGFNVFEHLKSDERFKTFIETTVYTQFLASQEVRRHSQVLK
jgi:tetratricopeptide (TPR) repeat protein